jgi:hypothetical protein
MHRAIGRFGTNMESVRQLGVIHQAFEHQVTEAVSLDELLRAEIVLAVGALDCYVHDVVRIRMTETLPLASGESDSFLNFGVSLNFVKRVLRVASEADRAVLFEQEVRRLHSFKTFQRPDAISGALSLIGVQSIWTKVGTAMAMTAADVKTELDLVVDRRNRIAHEADIDPSAGFSLKFPIDFPTVKRAVSFLESLVKTMHTVIVSEPMP